MGLRIDDDMTFSNQIYTNIVTIQLAERLWWYANCSGNDDDGLKVIWN